MAKRIIRTGTTADPTGDSLKNAFTKVNDNFTELYNALGLDADTLNIGAFEFSGSVMTTTDSSAITIDQAVTVTSNLTVGGDILPSTANGGDLGSLLKPFRSLYVSTGTVYMGGVPLRIDANNNLTVNDTVVGGADTGNIAFDTGGTAAGIYNSEGGSVVISNFSFWTDEAETAWIEIPEGNSSNPLRIVQEQGNVLLVADNQSWSFKVDGGTEFPTLTTERGDISSGTISGQTLLFGNDTREAVISTPNGTVSTTDSQRLVINPGKGYGSGEGGDIYLWAGRGGDTDGSGGDIKIRGGHGGGTGGSAGYIRMEGGRALGNGTAGFIEITSGESVDTQGGYVYIDAGYSSAANGGVVRIRGGQGDNFGGQVDIIGGYSGGEGADGQDALGGDVVISGGTAGWGSSNRGQVKINSNAGYWVFGRDGALTMPGGLIDAGSNGLELKSSNYAELFYQSADGDWQGHISENQLAYIWTDDSGASIQNIRGDDGEGSPQWTHTWHFDNDGWLNLPSSNTGIQGAVDYDLIIRVKDYDNDDYSLKQEVLDSSDVVRGRTRLRRDQFDIRFADSGGNTTGEYSFRPTYLQIPSDIQGPYGSSSNYVIQGADNNSIIALKVIDNSSTVQGYISLKNSEVKLATGAGANTLTFGSAGLTANTDLAIRVPSGIPSSVSNINSQGGYNIGSYTGLSTTSGTGNGLTVNASTAGNGYISTITIVTPGTGYTTGDTITLVGGDGMGCTFTVTVSTPTWEFGGDSSLTFPDTTVQTTAYQTTKSITHTANVLAGASSTGEGSSIAITDNYQTEKVLITNSLGDVGRATLPNVSVYGKIVILVSSSAHATNVDRNQWNGSMGYISVSNNGNGVVILMSLGSGGWKPIQTAG